MQSRLFSIVKDKKSKTFDKKNGMLIYGERD